MLLHLNSYLSGTSGQSLHGPRTLCIHESFNCVLREALVFAHKYHQCPVFSIGSQQGGSAVLGSVWLPSHMIHVL